MDRRQLAHRGQARAARGARRRAARRGAVHRRDGPGRRRPDLSAARGVAGTDPAVLLDEETVLAAYARHQEVQGGATREEQLGNLEHTYDEHLTRQLLVATEDQSSVFLGLDGVQALLGDRTVLLSLYLGAAEDQIAVYVLYMTSEDVGISVIPHGFPSSTLMIGELLTSPFALLVGQARRYVQDPPLGRRPVSRDAEELLDKYLRGLLGHVWRRWRQRPHMPRTGVRPDRGGSRSHVMTFPRFPSARPVTSLNTSERSPAASRNSAAEVATGAVSGKGGADDRAACDLPRSSRSATAAGRACARTRLIL